jgi:hypothetical protein
VADLSLAARAVLYAANRASSYGPDDCLNDSRFIAAAALRAAANNWCDEIATLPVNERTTAINDCADCLREIAAELDTTP